MADRANLAVIVTGDVLTPPESRMAGAAAIAAYRPGTPLPGTRVGLVSTTELGEYTRQCKLTGDLVLVGPSEWMTYGETYTLTWCERSWHVDGMRFLTPPATCRLAQGRPLPVRIPMARGGRGTPLDTSCGYQLRPTNILDRAGWDLWRLTPAWSGSQTLEGDVQCSSISGS